MINSVENKISKIVATAIASIPMIYNLLFFQINRSSSVEFITGIVVSLFILITYVAMVYTQNIYKYRRIFFIVTAFCFFPSFINHLLEARGQMSLTGTNVVKAEIPFCHIVIPLTIIPYALTETLIFPARLFNHYASVYSMLLIWLLATVTMGRGWCSWVCFYGGWDEAFSSIGKKKRIKLNASGPFARYFNFTMLIFLALVSLKTLSVAYCEWFCPFKLITEYSDPGSFGGYIQFILMVVLFFGLLLVLPYLTKTRFQCATFCPFGAFQSFFTKISPIKIVVDRDKCTDCQKCVNNCPTISLSRESIKAGKVHITCTLCGKCTEVCSKGAIRFRFSWLPKLKRSFPLPDTKLLRVLGLVGNRLLSPVTYLSFIGLLIGGIVGGSFMRDTLSLILRLFIGGHS